MWFICYSMMMLLNDFERKRERKKNNEIILSEFEINHKHSRDPFCILCVCVRESENAMKLEGGVQRKITMSNNSHTHTQKGDVDKSEG